MQNVLEQLIGYLLSLITSLMASLMTSLLALLLFTSPAHAAFHVLIDPGHGGADTGAVRGGIKEAEISLRVSLKLAEILRRDDRFKVSMTRETDKRLSLPARAEIAKRSQADLFLSVHCNSSTDSRAQGREFYFQNQLPADEEGLYLANKENDESETGDKTGDSAKDSDVADSGESVHEKISAKTDLKLILEDLRRNYRIHASSALSKIMYENWMESALPHHGSRVIRQAPFYVVSKVSMPSVLVELGFITHAIEGPRLARADFQDQLAKSLYDGLLKYKETIDKDRAGTLDSPP
jgi:N-acetylmuramoyl-L-alanine amidase